MVTCQSCNSLNTDDAKFCNKCGAPLAPVAGPVYQNPPSYQVNPQPVYQPMVVMNSKSRGTAMILEILPGLFGLLGFGWIYAGNTSSGLIWLIGYLVWIVIGVIISVVTGGFGAICVLPISIGAIVMSAVSLNNYTKKHPELFGNS
jgi:hypothetical protein